MNELPDQAVAGLSPTPSIPAWRRRKSIDDMLDGSQRRSLVKSLSVFQLTMFGLGSIIGTGIFVLTAEAATKAGPAMIFSFVLAAIVCGLTALCYAEVAAMIPVAGSAYTYSHAIYGRLAGWTVGWALVLEYAVSGSAVAVGWSGYMVGAAENALGARLPSTWVHGPFDPTPGLFNLPAFGITAFVTALLYIGTSESAKVNSALVLIKLGALALFLFFAFPAFQIGNFEPLMPYSFLKQEIVSADGSTMLAVGVAAASSSIFFAYVGFDTVSTAAEEARRPNRDIPVALIASLVICTILYVAVALAATGAVGAQPGGALAQSDDALAYVMRATGHDAVAIIIQLAAGIALPSVILMMIYGQTRIAFAMARDGLLPKVLLRLHPRFRTPHIITLATGLFVGIFAGLFPIGKLAEISNSGTLLAFGAVTIGVMILRRREPERNRPFRTPAIWIIAPLATLGCAFLFSQLSFETLKLFAIWSTLGFLAYIGLSQTRRADSAPKDLTDP